MHVGRERGGGGAVGDEQVDRGDQREGDEEDREQRRLGAELAPEDVLPIERIVPQVVDVEAGDRPSEDQDEQEEGVERDENSSTANTASDNGFA
jgi:hypothetical protein